MKSSHALLCVARRLASVHNNRIFLSSVSSQKSHPTRMQKNLSTTVDHQSLSAHACVQNAATGDLLTVTGRLKLTPVNITFDMVVSHFLFITLLREVSCQVPLIQQFFDSQFFGLFLPYRPLHERKIDGFSGFFLNLRFL